MKCNNWYAMLSEPIRVSLACRGEALKVVMDFTTNAGLLQVAQLLYQLEAMLLQSSPSATKVSHTC